MLVHMFCVFSITLIGLSAAELNLPVTTCKRNSDDYSICLKRAANEAWPRFVAGLPEFDFPSFDPLVIENERIVFNSSEIHGEVIVSNCTLLYLSGIEYIDVKTHYLDDIFRLQAYGQLPKLFMKMDVKVDGSLSVFRLVTEAYAIGHVNITLEGIKTVIDITGHVINNTWTVEHSEPAVSFAKFKLYYNTSSGENQEFYDVVVSFINEFSPIIFRQSWPFVKNTVRQRLIDYTNRLFSKVPFSNVFP